MGEFLIAGIIGLSLIFIHGIVHATLVATRAIPFMLIPAGLALSYPSKNERIARISLLQRWHQVVIIIVLVVMLLLLAGVVSTTTWSAVLNANIGAIAMARVDLADWPTGNWDDGRNVAALNSAEDMFYRALQWDPSNRTAHHRLGLIAMLRRDFTTAVSHLERAFESDPGHRGIHKSLGYSYVWSGDLERAADLLHDIPEAREEMQVYVWWWGTQGREDLSAYAEQMVERLQSSSGVEIENSPSYSSSVGFQYTYG